MPPVIEFVRGADIVAPGLSRAQKPLLDALTGSGAWHVHSHSFSSIDARLLFPWMYGPLPLRLALSRSDLVHVASAWYAHVIPMVAAPTVVTCYDLVELNNARGSSGYVKLHRRFHLAAMLRGMRCADRIVCSSYATARLVESYLPEASDRVRVVYSSISSTFLRAASLPSQREADTPYVLFVGSEQPRKNLTRLVEAMAEVRRTNPDLSLIKVGHHQTVEGRQHFLRDLRRTGAEAYTTIIEQVTDDRLVSLYRGATVTVLPSLEEGFGYPPLEAMACGSPAIVSDRGSLPEVTGGDALVVDPLDVRSIATAIKRIVTDQSLRSRLSAIGPFRAARFSEDRMVRAYLDVYREVMHRP